MILIANNFHFLKTFVWQNKPENYQAPNNFLFCFIVCFTFNKEVTQSYELDSFEVTFIMGGPSKLQHQETPR